MRHCSPQRAIVARTPSSEMVGLVRRSLVAVAQSIRSSPSLASLRRIAQPSLLGIRFANQTIDNRTGAGVARAAHAPRFRVAAVVTSQGRWDLVLHSGIFRGRSSLPCGGERHSSPGLTASPEIASMRRLPLRSAAGDHSDHESRTITKFDTVTLLSRACVS